MRVLAAYPVQDAQKYLGAFPKITQPKEVASFSRDASRKVHFDRRQLRTYRPVALPAALDEDMERYRPKAPAVADEPAPLGDVLAALAHTGRKPQRGEFVTFRNNLNKLFATPYSRDDDWEMGVERAADGSMRLQVRETARKTAEEASRSNFAKRAAYWGYRFEQLSTLSAEEAKAFAGRRSGGGSGYRVPSPSDAGSYDELYEEGARAQLAALYPGLSALGPVDANEEFCTVSALTIGKSQLLMAAEIDCKSDGSVAGMAQGYVELKTTKQHRSARDEQIFEKHKLLKFWLQSFLAGVPTIVVGFRDDDGRVLELKTLETRTIHRSVRPKGYWDPAVCFNFGTAVLEWLADQLAKAPASSASRWVLRYTPSAAAVQLLAEDASARAEDADDGGDRAPAKRARTE